MYPFGKTSDCLRLHGPGKVECKSKRENRNHARSIRDNCKSEKRQNNCVEKTRGRRKTKKIKETPVEAKKEIWKNLKKCCLNKNVIYVWSLILKFSWQSGVENNII